MVLPFYNELPREIVWWMSIWNTKNAMRYGKVERCTQMQTWLHGLPLLHLKTNILQYKNHLPCNEGLFQPSPTTQLDIFSQTNTHFILLTFQTTVDAICAKAKICRHMLVGMELLLQTFVNGRGCRCNYLVIGLRCRSHNSQQYQCNGYCKGSSPRAASHEIEAMWLLHFKHSHCWKRRSRSKFASHYT